MLQSRDADPFNFPLDKPFGINIVWATVRLFFIWLTMVMYAIASTWAINRYWKHDAVMKIVVLTPVGVVVAGLLLWILFEEQFWRIRHEISRRRALRRGPLPQQDLVTVHLFENYLSSVNSERWDIFALQEDLRRVIKKEKLGSFDGNEIGAEEAVLFMSGPDAEAIFRTIEPLLRACPLCQGGIARIKRCAPNETEREVRLG